MPAGGAVFTSPADAGDAHRPGKPKKQGKRPFSGLARDRLADANATSGAPARGRAGGGRGTSLATDFEDSEGEGMSESEIQSAMHLMVTDAILYVDGELSPQRAKLADLYAGKAFGNEEEGRSTFVMTVVRDTIKRMMPSLLRIFFGADHAVEYAPRRAEKVAEAEQQTEYITQVVINEDNRGFQVFHEWFMDALLKNLGIVKWWTDRSIHKRTYRQSGMTAEQVETLDQDPEVTNLSHEDDGDGTFDVTYIRERKHVTQRFVCIPPEEFLHTRGARTVVDDSEQPGVALFVGHRTQLTRSQLRAAGVSDEDIDAYAFRDASLDHNVEEISRQAIVKPEIAEVGPVETRRALYIEGYPYLDIDGDGIAELCRVIMLGPSYKVISVEAWDERPFAILTPDPQPHTIIGLGVGDYTQDLQRVMSMVARAALDSLAFSVNPRMGYVEGEVSLEDVLNTDVGAPIRMSQPGMVEPIVYDFVGKDAVEVLMTFFEEVLENRVGVSKDTAGLNPETLQSTTAVAISSAVSAAQQHIEMIARVFAEMGVKPLMKGLLKEVVKHPSPERVFRFRGQYVPASPRAWDADLDVRVNVAIGAGLDAEKLDFLVGVIQKQEELLKTIGPSPIVDFPRYAKTLVKVAKQRGRMDADEFFGIPQDGWQPPPQPNPEQQKAQIEQQKAQADAQADMLRAQATAQSEQVRAQSEAQKRQAEIEAELMRVRIEEQSEAAKHQTALEKIRREHELKIEELKLEMELERIKLAQEMELAREKAAQERSLAADKHEHEKRMREKEVDHAGAAADKKADAEAKAAGESKSVHVTISHGEGE